LLARWAAVPRSQGYFQQADLNFAVSVVRSLNASDPVIDCKKNLGETTVEVSLNCKDTFDDKSPLLNSS
jgi:hypothetical protein